MSKLKNKLPKCSNEKFTKFVSIQIEIYERLMSMKESFYEVFKKFDGKVADKRLVDALEKVCPTHEIYGGRLIPDFSFSFENYKGELSVRFCGVIEDNNDLYFSNFQNEFTFHNYPYLYNERIDMEKFDECYNLFYETIEKQIAYHIKNLSNYDEVSKVYEKAYRLLASVNDKKDFIHYAERYGAISDVPHLNNLRNVYISLEYRNGKK